VISADQRHHSGASAGWEAAACRLAWRRHIWCADAVQHQFVRTTLDIDDDVVAAAREFAAAERRSLGAVISELARRGLTPARIEAEDGLPVIRVPSGTPPITPEMVPACARL